MSTNLKHKFGSDKTITFELKDKNGDPYPITGTLYFWIVKQKGDAAALVTKSSPSSGVTITYAAGGLGSVAVARADVAALTGKNFWSLWEENGSAKRIPLGDGEYNIETTGEVFATA